LTARPGGLPFNNSTGIFYLNKDLFKAAGVDVAKFPETWTDFKDMLKSIKAKAPADVALFNLRPGSYWIPQAYLYTFGGEFIAPDNKSVNWDTKEFLECLTYFRDLQKEGLLAWNASIDGFYAGKQFIVTESTGGIGNMIKNSKFDLGTQKIMRGSQQKAVIGGGTIHIMAGQTRGAQEAAWNFMKFLTNKDSQVYWSNTTGYLACNKAAVEELTNTTHKTDPRFAVAFKQMVYAVRENISAAASFDAVRDVFVDAWDRVMVKGEDPKTVLVDAQKKANQVIKDF
jgi:sn-glycerol 3-phosphate transport system substrate-binding protein